MYWDPIANSLVAAVLPWGKSEMLLMHYPIDGSLPTLCITHPFSLSILTLAFIFYYYIVVNLTAGGIRDPNCQYFDNVNHVFYSSAPTDVYGENWFVVQQFSLSNPT
jgi:hypothetical protein